MISAFGVTHSISKSYVPGVGYKAAKTLDQTERHIVRNKSLGNMAHWKAAGTPEKRAPKEPRQLYPGVSLKQGKLRKITHFSRKDTNRGPEIEGFSLPDGRGGGHVVVHTDATDPVTTHAHEMAHIAPRRNPEHLHQRMKDDFKRGREEGRADFIAHGKQSTGSYPGGDRFKSGYNEVQGKMAAGKFRNELRQQMKVKRARVSSQLKDKQR